MQSRTEYYHSPATVSIQTPTADNLESLFFLIHGRDWLEGCTQDYSDEVVSGIWVTTKDSSLFTKLCKLWSAHTKSLQENRLLKTEKIEKGKNFKSHNFKVGQLVAVKNHLRNTFETKFVSDYRLSKIVNEHTLLIESPDWQNMSNLH